MSCLADQESASEEMGLAITYKEAKIIARSQSVVPGANDTRSIKPPRRHQPCIQTCAFPTRFGTKDEGGSGRARERAMHRKAQGRKEKRES